MLFGLITTKSHCQEYVLLLAYQYLVIYIFRV